MKNQNCQHTHDRTQTVYGIEMSTGWVESSMNLVFICGKIYPLTVIQTEKNTTNVHLKNWNH